MKITYELVEYESKRIALITEYKLKKEDIKRSHLMTIADITYQYNINQTNQFKEFETKLNELSSQYLKELSAYNLQS